MFRTVLATIAALTGFALVAGFAASMTVNTASLGSGTATVAACDPNGVDLAFGIDPAVSTTAIQSIELSDVAAACDAADYVLDLGGTVTSGVLAVDGTGASTIDVSSLGVAAGSLTSVTLTVTG